MAPLSGIESTSSSPLWHRVADTIYERGERLYDFQGLRAWKNKFDPVWQPRYLASRSGIALPWVLGDVIRLISLKTPKLRTFGPASPSLTSTDSPQAQTTQT
jgi:phosphatidylglycerol lysyltransferase